MNNINQKNVIFGLNSDSELPYSSIEHVNHQTGSELNSHYVNTSMQQLLDNDLYIENMLQATSAYMVGPKAYSENTISSKPNGYKAYGELDTADCLDIWRKAEKNLSATVTKIGNFGEVNFIYQYGNIVFAGTSNKLLYKNIEEGQNIANSSTGWNTLINKQTNNYWSDGTKVFFGTSNGVYQLSTYIDLNNTDPNPNYGKKTYAAVCLNSTIGNVTAVAYSKKKKLLVAATGNNNISDPDNNARVYIAQYNNVQDFSEYVGKTKFNEAPLYAWTGSRCERVTKKHIYDADVLKTKGDLILGTYSGLFTQYNKSTLKNYKTFTPLPLIGEDIICKGLVEFCNQLYAFTDNGIYRIDPNNNTETQVLTAISGDIKDICVDERVKAMYIATAYEIYRVDQMMNFTKLSEKVLNNTPVFSSDASICRLQTYFDGKILIALNHSAATSRGCYYFTYDDFFCINKIDCAIENPIVDLCAIKAGIIIADTNKLYILRNIQQQIMPSSHIRSFQLHTINRIPITQSTLKILTLHTADYQHEKNLLVTQSSVIDIMNGAETYLNGANVADCFITVINDIEAIILATDLGVKVCTLISDDYDNLSLNIYNLNSDINNVEKAFELANSLVFTNPSQAFIIPKTLDSIHNTNSINGHFNNPAVVNNIIYGLNETNVKAYQEFSNPIKSANNLSNAYIRNIDIYTDINDAIAVKAVDGTLQIDFLSAADYDTAVLLSTSTLIASEVQYAGIAQYNSGAKIVFSSSSTKTIGYAAYKPDDDTIVDCLSLDYTNLTAASASDICLTSVNDIEKYDNNGTEAVFLAGGDGLYVHKPQYELTSTYVQQSQSPIRSFGIACLYVDDLDDGDGHEYVIDDYSTVMLSGAAFEFNNANIQMMTAYRFSYAYNKGTSNQITAYYQQFTGSIAAFCNVTTTTFNSPGNVVDAFNYFNEFINWDSRDTQFYTAYFMTDNAIYRKSNDLSLLIYAETDEYKYTPGTSFTAEANNSNTTINGVNDITVNQFKNGDVSYGRNPYVMAACSLSKGGSLSSNCLLFYKIRDNASANDIGHFIKSGDKVLARAIDIKSFLADGENIDKAYFFNGPDVGKNVTIHTEDSWPGFGSSNVQWTVDAPIMTDGIYTICIKTDRKVFNIDVQFTSNGSNFTNAAYVDNSYIELYSSLLGMTHFCKKSISTNKYDHIIAIIGSSVINVVQNSVICNKGIGANAIKDVFPMNGLFEGDRYTYYVLTDNGTKKLTNELNYFGLAQKCGNYSNKSSQQVCYCSQTNVLFFVIDGKLFAVTDKLGALDLQNLVEAASTVDVTSYKQETKYNGNDIGALIGCYADAKYVYCYTNKQIFRFTYSIDEYSENIKKIIVNGSGIIFKDLNASDDVQIERVILNAGSYNIYNYESTDSINVFEEYSGINNDIIFFATNAQKGIWYFDDNLLKEVENSTKIKSGNRLFSAEHNTKLGALSGTCAYIETVHDGNLQSYDLNTSDIGHCFYDDIYGQLYVFNRNRTLYGDGITANTPINLDAVIYSIAVLSADKYLCTNRGLYKADSYINYILTPGQLSTTSKQTLTLNGSNGSNVGIVHKGIGSRLNISQYNITRNEWTDLQLSTAISSFAKNDKDEVSATNMHIIEVYPISAFYANSQYGNTLYCQLDTSDDVIDDINSKVRSAYGHDNFTIDTNCLYDVNYGTKLMNNYEDVMFRDYFPYASKFYQFKNTTYICNGSTIESFNGYSMITCFMRVEGTDGYNISGIINGINSNLVLNTNNGICMYSENGEFIQGKTLLASSIGRWMPDGRKYIYICASGSQLYFSENCRIWKPLFTVKCNGTTVNDIRSICILDSKTYCFGSSTGLYCTKYQFDIVKDVKAFTQTEALELYEQLMALPNTGISAQTSNTISVHVDTEHCYQQSFVFYKNKDNFLDSSTKQEVIDKVKAAYAAEGISITSGEPKQIIDNMNALPDDLVAVANYVISLAEKEQNGTSLIAHLNNDFIDIKMEDIDPSWQLSENTADDLVIRNDIVSEIYFGRWIDGDVVAVVSNYLDVANEDDEYNYTDISSLTYIMKRWMSGMTELYINIPTTNTYYLANTYGAADCTRSEDDAYQRPNLYDFSEKVQTQSSKISEHYTSISVGIASCEYHIDNLLGVQINGNSLPLKIYKDDKSSSSIGASMYRSMSEPSLLKPYEYDLMHTDEDGNYIFNFAVFGSDAQAVMLQFYDSKARSNQPWIRVTFDPNGGEGEMPKQKFLIKEDGSLEQKTLKGNKFTNKQGDVVKIFNGWTISPQPENYSDWDGESYDGTQVYTSNGPNQNKGIMWPHGTTKATQFEELMRLEEPFANNEEITLYASWITYQFSDSDTTIMMNSDTSQFTIAAVGLSANTKLKDNVVINFGD